jgi:hypothetical protein
MPCDPSVHGKKTGMDASSVVPPGAFSVAFGNPANAGYLYGLTMLVDLRVQGAINQRDAYPQEETDRLVESMGVQGGEPLGTRVKDFLHVQVETLTPSQFLDGAESFLNSVGVNGFTEASIDNHPIQPGDPGKLNLQEAIRLCRDRISKDHSVRAIEISSTGKNEEFSLLLNFFYSSRHRWDQPPVRLEVRAMSNELGPKEGESFSDYRVRMNAIDTDVHKRARIYDAIEAEKKALYSDFAHHLTEAFPGVRLQLYESVAQGENQGPW